MTLGTGICSMTKAEIKKLVETCVKTLAKAKDIDLSVFNTVDRKDWGQLIFDIKLEPNSGTELYIDYDVLEDNNDKVEFGKAVMSKIWGDIKDHLENDIDKQMRRNGLKKVNIPGFNGIGGIYQPYNAPIKEIKDNGDGIYTVSIGGYGTNCNNSQKAYNKADIDMTLEGYKLQQLLKQHKTDLLSESKDQSRFTDEDFDNIYRKTYMGDWNK